ncbi:MAG: hypothetical protein LBR26_14380 [Prevotella sp.]|nr:hypothetical protein [Prevotella sp.]
MKKISLFALILFISQICLAQKGSLDLTKAEVVNCELEDGKTLISYSHNGKLHLPVNDYKGFKGLSITYSDFEKTGEVTNGNIGSVNIIYTGKDGNEKTATWVIYRTGKKNLKFNAWETSTGGDKISIDPESIQDIYLGIGKNKKVDIVVSLDK